MFHKFQQMSYSTLKALLSFDMLQELSANKGNTIITVTHDIDFAHRADRIIEIADGRIVN